MIINIHMRSLLKEILNSVHYEENIFIEARCTYLSWLIGETQEIRINYAEQSRKKKREDEEKERQRPLSLHHVKSFDKQCGELTKKQIKACGSGEFRKSL